MRIRGKLLVLLLAIALLPLGFLTVSHYFGTRDLGRELAGRSREALTQRARGELIRLVKHHTATVRRRAQYLELVLQVQQESVEILLEAPPPAQPRVRFAADLDRAPTLPEDFEASPVHLRSDADGTRQPIPITFASSVFRLLPGSDRKAVRADVERLSLLDDVLPFLHRASRGMVYWHFTALENGVYTVYPGHAGYPDDYDPRERGWYREAVAANDLIRSEPYIDVSTGRATVTLARPIHDVTGRIVGVTGIDVLVSEIAADIRPPIGLSEAATAMLVLPVRDVDEAGGKPRLAVIARPGMSTEGGTWQEALEREWVASDEPAGLAAMTEDLVAGRAGSRLMRWQGRDALWAYGPLGRGRISSLVLVVPQDDVVAEGRAMEDYALRRTARQTEQAILFGVVVLAAVLLLAVAVSRAVTRPLQRLVGAVRRVGEGDFDARAEISSRDEIGELGDSFNEMVVQLEDRMTLRQSIELAREVQQNLLPSEPPRIDGLDVSGASLYCDETGGDYFDFLQLVSLGPDHLGVAVGDVTGHGIAAAMLMTTGRALLRSRALEAGSLGPMLDPVNALLCADTSRGRFMTLYYLVVDARKRSVRWVSAGHDAAILYDPAADRFDELAGEDIPLGVDPGWSYRETGPRELAEGQLLFIGTDGIWEARAPGGEMFGKDRLRATLRAHAAESAEAIRDAVTAAVKDFEAGDPQRDDVTLVVLKLRGGAPTA